MPLSSRTRSVLTGVSGVVLGGVIAGAIALIVWPVREPAHATGITTTLAPDPTAVRYRFNVANGTDPRVELDEMITALDARVKGAATPSPLDMSELADVYYQRGQLTGDKNDYAQAETLATKSLEILPSPNGATLTLA